MIKTYYSNGKLLLTGEYTVLEGSLSLALPTQLGQSLRVEEIDVPKLIWKSLDHNDKPWFKDEFRITNGLLKYQQTHILNEQIGVKESSETSKALIKIFNAVKKLNPNFLNTNQGYRIITKLDFPRDWGLGSSSTLINNIASWANVNPYKLLELTLGGSGYDIACAQYNTPITYQLKGDYLQAFTLKERIINKVDFNPSFKAHLYFVYLNRKQNSQEAIAQYNANKSNHSQAILNINKITSKIIDCTSLMDFEKLITAHEQIISKIINQKSIKELLFADYKGAIKSLGAWGGDFILVTAQENPKTYFEAKGFKTVIEYKNMILEATA